MIKPLARKQARLTKQIRLGNIPPEGVGTPDPDEQEAMVDVPLENLLKKLVKQKKPAPIVVTPRPSEMKMEPATPGPSGAKMKKEMSTAKPPVPPKPPGLKTPPPSTSKKRSGGFKKAALSGATKGFLKSIGIDPKFIDDDNAEDETPKGAKGKQPKKIRKTGRKTSRRLGRVGQAHQEETELWQDQEVNPREDVKGDGGSIFRNCWARPASSFIGLATNTWVPAPN